MQLHYPEIALHVPTLLLPAVFGRRADPWDSEESLVLVWPAVGVLLLLVAVAGRLPESGMLVLFSLGSSVWALQSGRDDADVRGAALGAAVVVLVAVVCFVVFATFSQPSTNMARRVSVRGSRRKVWNGSTRPL